jgi:ATP-dependent helicase/nuclease subunit B
MMDLVTGAFHPGLEGAFAETFARLRREDPLAPLAVVASSRRLSDRLKEVALEAVPEGFAAVRFFNLFSFARTIHEEAPPSGFRVILDDLFPSRLLAAILRRHFADGLYLSRAALSARSLVGALHELKAAAVRPEHALEMLAFKDLGLEDAPKLAEILSLYKRYSDELRRRRIHVRADVIRTAAELAPRSGWLGSLRHVLYYGFYDLDQNQLDLLREVRRRVPVTVFFPHVDSPAYGFGREFLKTIIAPMAGSVRELPAPPPPSRPSILSASGAADEVWAAAKEVLRFADRGIPWDRIGVVARTLDPYADLVETVFRENRIPWVSSARRRLGHDPRVKAARLLFSLEDFDRAHVLDLLRSPFFRPPGGDRELWDQASRLMGIGHGEGEWRRRLGGAAGKDYVYRRGGRVEGKTFMLPREEVDLFWGAVRGLLEANRPPESGWKDFSDWALERYRRFLEPDPRVEREIGSLASLEGLAMEEPLALLLDRLSGLSEPAGGEGGVQVLDAMAARGLPFRALVVLGMNERVFPRYILEDPFLRDAVRSRLEHRLGCRMARKLEGYEEERMLFALLMGSAEEIVLCTQRSDEKGRLQIPSAFLPGPARAVPRRPAERLKAAPFDLLTPREASLRTGQGEALGRAMGWDVEMLVEAGAFLRQVESRGPLTPYDGRVDAGAYWQAAASRGLSPTGLERLAECPFRYFASRMLGLEELEEPEAEESLHPIEIGEIYHDILERFHRSGGKDLGKEIRAGFRRFEETRSIRYPVLWEVERARFEKVLRAFVDADDLSVFKPAEFEVPLEMELALEVGGRRAVAFRGFADRLDLGPGGSFRVVDYKKGRGKYRSAMETGIFKKGYLQPPLYTLMAAGKVKGADLARSKFVYYFLEEVLEESKWELALEGAFWERRREFEDHLRRLLETIPRGEFAIRPGDGCGTCEFRTMCRRSHRPTVLRAAENRREGPEEVEE